MDSIRKSSLFAAAIVLAASILHAQETPPAPPPAGGDSTSPWSGSIALALTGQSIGGNRDSFRSQTNLQSGVAIDEILLDRRGAGGTPQLKFRASGFGPADPSRRARVELRFRQPLMLAVSYDRRESFLGLTAATTGLRQDDSAIARWNVRMGWDGWRSGRVTLDLRRTSHTGTALSPSFLLNERYPLRIGLDEKMSEASIRFESRGLPAQFSFEQGFARHERRDRTAPAGANAIGVSDPDVLLAATTSRFDRQNIPTSRAVVTFGNAAVEGAAALRWTPSRLRATVPVTTSFGIAGGNAGGISFIDQVAGSASRDTLLGNVRLAARLANRWTLRVSADHRDTSTDATLLGQRLVKITNPDGYGLDLSGPLTGQSIFDYTDTSERLEVERAGEQITIRAGAIASQRNVNDVRRHSTGAILGGSWRQGRLSTSAELEHGTFQHYVFRTDPRTVNRLHLRIATPLRPAWRLQGEGRFERSANPGSVSALEHRSNAGSLDLSWAPAARSASAGLSVGMTNLRTRTDLVLPGNAAGASIYDLSLLTTTAHGQWTPGRYSLYGAVTRARDNGSTWPVGTWNGNVRATMRVGARADVGLFAERWSYNERLATADDFDADRYGVLLIWRIQ